MKTNILIDNIERETEKAYLIQMPVFWNMVAHTRKFWFPKKCVEIVNDSIVGIDAWLVEKLEKENAFNGYRMTFQSAE